MVHATATLFCYRHYYNNAYLACTENWQIASLYSLPERFCRGDSLRRGAISSVWTFTFTFTFTASNQTTSLKKIIIVNLIITRQHSNCNACQCVKFQGHSNRITNTWNKFKLVKMFLSSTDRSYILATLMTPYDHGCLFKVNEGQKENPEREVNQNCMYIVYMPAI